MENISRKEKQCNVQKLTAKKKNEKTRNIAV